MIRLLLQTHDQVASSELVATVSVSITSSFTSLHCLHYTSFTIFGHFTLQFDNLWPPPTQLCNYFLCDSATTFSTKRAQQYSYQMAQQYSYQITQCRIKLLNAGYQVCTLIICFQSERSLQIYKLYYDVNEISNLQ